MDTAGLAGTVEQEQLNNQIRRLNRSIADAMKPWTDFKIGLAKLAADAAQHASPGQQKAIVIASKAADVAQTALENPAETAIGVAAAAWLAKKTGLVAAARGLGGLAMLAPGPICLGITAAYNAYDAGTSGVYSEKRREGHDRTTSAAYAVGRSAKSTIDTLSELMPGIWTKKTTTAPGGDEFEWYKQYRDDQKLQAIEEQTRSDIAKHRKAIGLPEEPTPVTAKSQQDAKAQGKTFVTPAVAGFEETGGAFNRIAVALANQTTGTQHETAEGLLKQILDLLNGWVNGTKPEPPKGAPN
jgi:hypothetical protein